MPCEYTHQKGGVLTGAAAAGVSTMTDGAAAVIPEVLAGQVLSLARRGRGGHTVLAASSSGAGEAARDRLVVLLQPILADGDDGSSRSGDNKVRVSGGSTKGSGPHGERGAERDAERDADRATERYAAGADERPRHALVVSCAPGQVRTFFCIFFSGSCCCFYWSDPCHFNSGPAVLTARCIFDLCDSLGPCLFNLGPVVSTAAGFFFRVFPSCSFGCCLLCFCH